MILSGFGRRKTKPNKANLLIPRGPKSGGIKQIFSFDLRGRIVRLMTKRLQISILDFCFSISDLKIDNWNSAIGNQVNF